MTEPPKLKREITTSVLEPAWHISTHRRALLSWANCKKVFPAFFRGDLQIHAVEYTRELKYEIMRHNGTDTLVDHFYQPTCFVGRVIRHVMDPLEEPCPGDIMYTAASFGTRAIAIYEASLMAIESMKTIIRHLLYMSSYYNTPSCMELQVETILSEGSYPDTDELIAADDLDNDRVPASTPHPPE